MPKNEEPSKEPGRNIDDLDQKEINYWSKKAGQEARKNKASSNWKQSKIFCPRCKRPYITNGEKYICETCGNDKGIRIRR